MKKDEKTIADLSIKKINEIIEFHYNQMIYYSELKGEKMTERLNKLTQDLHGINKDEEGIIRQWIENGLSDDEIIEGICFNRYQMQSLLSQAEAEEKASNNSRRKK